MLYKELNYESESDENMEIGECCFCGGECNPMSQSCGSCSRGIAGAGIGIPAPDHLKKYLNNYCCQSCGTKENNIQLSKIKHYEESTFIYCLDCLGKNDPSDICEICNKNIIGFTCKKDNDLIYIYICYDCKFNGEKCEYC
tara:strand:- start:708 stop:1130 length:423 start_codon:yes stop_codon:yes gene_type:complete